jgi:hypothetical protein
VPLVVPEVVLEVVPPEVVLPEVVPLVVVPEVLVPLVVPEVVVPEVVPEVVVPLVVPVVVVPDVVPVVVVPLVVPDVVPLVLPDVVLGVALSSSPSQAVARTSHEHSSVPDRSESHLRFIKKQGKVERKILDLCLPWYTGLQASISP